MNPYLSANLQIEAEFPCVDLHFSIAAWNGHAQFCTGLGLRMSRVGLFMTDPCACILV